MEKRRPAAEGHLGGPGWNPAVLRGFANGKRSGTGTEYDPNGQVRYTGKWAENAWNGEGVWYREDGHVIKGQFRSGAVDGQAVEYSKNGVKLYEGGFENGVYSGRGCRYFPGGGRYEGSFLDGKPVGWLSGYDADGSLVYEGHWENDEFQGQGRYFSNGEKVYEGEFSHNQFEGQGLEYQNGEIAYRGGYVCSSREGLGVLYENGEPRYAGEFRQNRMHGRINEIQNGRVLAECVYQDGVLRYEKRYSLSDGKPYLAFEGFMKNGKPGGMGCRYNPYGEKGGGRPLPGRRAGEKYAGGAEKNALAAGESGKSGLRGLPQGPGIWNRTVGLRRNLHRRPEKRPSERPGDPSAGRP